MKKKLLGFVLALCLIIPSAFLLSACGGGESHTHSYVIAKYDENGHWMECACGERSADSEKEHSYLNNCDDTCEGCAYRRAAPHNYNTENWESSENKHWHICRDCNSPSTMEDHEYGNYVSVDGTTHKRTCTICGKDEETGVHNWDEEWHSDDGTGHYHICTDCGAHSTKASHTYGDWANIDADQHGKICADCGYVLKADHNWDTSWHHDDETGHYHICEDCGVHSETVAHTDDDWDVDYFNGIHYHTCTECKCTYGKEEHTYSESWAIVSDSHYHKCSKCGSKDSSIDHSYSNGVCKTCGKIYKLSVAFDNNVYKISDGTNVTAPSITLPAKYDNGTNGEYPVTAINASAFKSNKNIQEVIIPEGVTSVGSDAFYYCTGLTSITIPASVTSIGKSAFTGCDNLTKVNYLGTIDQWAQISFYNVSANPVSFAESLYINNEKVTTVNLATTNTIKQYAFYNCESITSLTIGDSVTSIGKYAFNVCTGLTDVTISDSVTSVGDSAFMGCNNLTKVNYLGTIDQWAQISFELYAANPVSFAESLYINNEKVTTVNLTTASTIKQSTFYNCKSITSLTIGDSVTSIGEYAFDGCTGLTNVTISDSVTSIGEYAFYGCTGLMNVTIPNSVTYIDEYAFYRCTGLTNVTIPDSVTSIGKYAFDDCNNLKKVNYLGTIDQWAQISFDGNKANPISFAKSLYINNEEMTTVNLTTTSTINKYAFYNCAGITSLIIGDSVTSIKEYAFCGCTGLTSVTIPNSVTSIGEYAFSACTGLREVALSNKLTWIDDYTFKGCSSLYEIIIPNSVSVIGHYAFDGCTGLYRVTIGSGVTSIWTYAFNNCTKLREVYNLSTLAISKNTENGSVGKNATNIYTSTSGSRQLFFKNGCVVYGTTIIDYIDDSAEITIPQDTTTIGSSAFKNIIYITSVTIPEGVTTINSYAFYGCTGLTSVTLPESLTTINSYAFYGCTGLTNITIPDGVTSIGECAFSDCTGLTELIMDGDCLSLKKVATKAFYNCTNLERVTIGGKYKADNNTGTLYSDAFGGCEKLTTIIIGDKTTDIDSWLTYVGGESITAVIVPISVTNIYQYSFRNQSNLQAVYYKGTASEWQKITISSNGNSYLNSATIYYYSATQPTGSGNYWHYDTDGKTPVAW